MEKYSDFQKRMTTETVYFKNEFENAFIKSVPGKGYFVKMPGTAEFKAENDSELITDAYLEGKEITAAEYNEGPK